MTWPYPDPGRPRPRTALEEALAMYRPMQAETLDPIVAHGLAPSSAPTLASLLGQAPDPNGWTGAAARRPPPLAAALAATPSDATRTPGDRFAPRTEAPAAPADRPAFVNEAAARGAGLTGERNAAGLGDIITAALDPAQASPQVRAVQARQRGEDYPAPASSPMENVMAGAQRQLGGSSIELEQPRAGWQMLGAAVPFGLEAAVSAPFVGATAARLGAAPMAYAEGAAVGRGEQSVPDALRNVALGAAGGEVLGPAMHAAGSFAGDMLQGLPRILGDESGAVKMSKGYQGPDNVPGRVLGGRFYSRLYETADRLNVSKAPVESWIAKLTGSGGFKREEYDQVIRPWLEAQPRGTKLTKEEVLGAIDENLPQVHETLRGYDPPPEHQALIDAAKVRQQAAYEAMDAFRTGNVGTEDVPHDLWREASRANQEVMHLENQYGLAPRWGEYTPPGGENYRNVLLQVPPTRAPTPEEAIGELRKHILSMPNPGHPQEWTTGPVWDMVVDNMSRGEEPAGVATHELPMANVESFDPEARGMMEMNTRGTRVIEHADGSATIRSSQGPLDELPAKNVVEAKDMVERYWASLGAADRTPFEKALQLAEARHPKDPIEYKSPHWQERDVFAHMRPTDVTTPEGKKYFNINELQSDWHQQGREQGYAAPGAERRYVQPPEGPFSRTQDWMGLGLKRAIDEAVGGGYHGLTWSTPEAISDALQMSSAADLLELRQAGPAEGGNTFLRGYRSGSRHPILEHDVSAPGSLEGLIGHDLSARLRAAQPEAGQYEGTYGSAGSRFLNAEQMKVYPKGNTAFYGEMIPDWLKAYNKEQGYGMKPVDVPVKGHPADMVPRYVSEADGEPLSGHMLEASARELRANAEEAAGGRMGVGRAQIKRMKENANALLDASVDLQDHEAVGGTFHDWYTAQDADTQDLIDEWIPHSVQMPGAEGGDRVTKYFSDVGGQPEPMSAELLTGMADMLGDLAQGEEKHGGEAGANDARQYREHQKMILQAVDRLALHEANGGHFHDWFVKQSPELQDVIQMHGNMTTETGGPGPVLRTQKGFDFTPEMLAKIAQKGQPLLGIGAIFAAMAAAHAGGHQ